MSDERTEHGQPTDPADRPPTEPARPAAPGSPREWPSPPDPYATEAGPPGAPQQWPSAGGSPAPQWPAPPPEPPQAGARGVHPLDAGRALSVGWSLFRFRWLALLGTAVVVMLPAYLLQLAITVSATGSFEAWGLEVQTWLRGLGPGEEPELADLPPFPVAAVLAAMASGILTSVAGIVVGGALVHIIGSTYGGRRGSAGAALRQSVARLPSLLGAGLLVGLVLVLTIFGGVVLMAALFAAVGFQAGPLALLAFVVLVATFAAVIFLAIRWQFYTQAIMLEGAGAIASLGRSWRLVSGSGWRVLGYLILLAVIAMLVGLIASIIAIALFGLPTEMQTGTPVAYDPVRSAGHGMVSGIVSLLILPFYTAVLTLLYYDLRWRRQEQIGPPPD